MSALGDRLALWCTEVCTASTLRMRGKRRHILDFRTRKCLCAWKEGTLVPLIGKIHNGLSAGAIEAQKERQENDLNSTQLD